MSGKFKDRMNQHSELERARKTIEKKNAKSEKGINMYSYVLSAICVVLAVLFFVYGSLLLGVIFLSAALLLWLVVYLSVRLEKKEEQKNDKED